MFPHIKHIDDLLPFVSGNSQIRVKPCETTGHTVVCYMVQDEDTFAGEHEHYERECRGITFGPDGKVTSRTMHKFFNIGQRDDVQPEALHWPSVDRIMEKRDGSMITPVLLSNGSIKCKTKKSFTTKEAALADQVIAVTPGGAEWIVMLLATGWTPTFEITTPKYPIVVLYKTDELTLLHVRHNETGRYMTERELKAIEVPCPLTNISNPDGYGTPPASYPFKCPFPMVENQASKYHGPGVPANVVSWDILKKYAEETTGVEGLVIQFTNGDMVKLKTVWYCDLHHAVTFTRWRDVARAVVADKSDDLKGAFALTGRDIAPIELVERTIKSKCDLAEAIVRAIVSTGVASGNDAKAMALEYKEHQMFGQIMAVFRGKDIDWMAWYDKNHLDADWTLEVVGEEG